MKNLNNTKLAETYTRNLQRLQEEFDQGMERLQSDFSYEITWVGESLFVNSLKIKLYKEIITAVENNNLELTIKSLEEFISRSYNVRTNSTNELTNTTSTWKYIQYIKVLEELRSTINWCTEE